MPIPIPPAETAPLVVPLRDVLVVVAILVVLAIASNLSLLAYLSTQSSPSISPSPARGECVWEKGPGDEGPGEAGSSPFTPRPLAGLRDGINRPGVRASGPGGGPGEAGSGVPVR